jgi:hypothetical protein
MNHMQVFPNIDANAALNEVPDGGRFLCKLANESERLIVMARGFIF